MGFMSLIAVYAPTEVCETEEMDVFYAKLDSVLDRCPSRDTLVILGDFNATAGTERDGYEIYSPSCILRVKSSAHSPALIPGLV